MNISPQTFSDAPAVVRKAVSPLTEDRHYDRILTFIGDAPLVLLGEATHGTHDFYAVRAQITRALIEQHGFSGVAIEGDWPDAWRVNRFVQGADGANEAAGALEGFARFPTWMWRNTAVESFVIWLREHNATRRTPEQHAGFYGLDLYSLHASMRAVVQYLEERDPTAARAAKKSYACFDTFGPEAETYAWASTRVKGEICADAVTRELISLRQRRADLLQRDGIAASDEFFYAEQNARLARNAEEYYRTMFRGRVASWNLRDQHMAETLEQLLEHLRHRGQPPKVVVWAHNSHLGDARATYMGDIGELNLGQLTRERIASNARLIGFTTYSGTVIAASDWGAEAERKRVRPALKESYEDLFHATGVSRFFLPLEKGTDTYSLLAQPRLERAIGVIYRPDTERQSHYFEARLADQFDAVIHFDESHAVEPLPGVEAWPEYEVPETFPSGV